MKIRNTEVNIFSPPPSPSPPSTCMTYVLFLLQSAVIDSEGLAMYAPASHMTGEK
jgi:hypothetical protein